MIRTKRIDGFDAETYKVDQRTGWGSTAEGWVRFAETTERNWAPMSRRLLELVGVRRGDRVLDIACGIGEPSLTAAEIVGPNGRVLGIDLAPEMVEIAAKRAADRGLANVEFRVGDADVIDLSGETFDAAVCRWGLMFFADPSGALKRIRAALRPGGRFAACTVGRADRYALIDTVLGGIVRALEVAPPPPPPPGAPGFFSLSDDTVVREHFERAGFNDVAVEHFGVDFVFKSPEEVSKSEFAINAIVKGFVETRPERRDRAVAAVAELARQHLGSDGLIHYPPETNDNLYVVGTRS